MKATELMIGDWVIHPNYGKIQIKAIPNTDATYSPIPLTPEILEKNGWNSEHIDSQGYPSDADWYYYNWNIPTRYAKISGKENMIFLDCSIIYVHELQHALRLCGLNDLADNFKI